MLLRFCISERFKICSNSTRFPYLFSLSSLLIYSSITHWFKNEKSFLPLTYSTRLILNLIYSTNILNFSYTSHLHPFPFFSKKNLKLIFPSKISHSTSTIHQAPITHTIYAHYYIHTYHYTRV